VPARGGTRLDRRWHRTVAFGSRHRAETEGVVESTSHAVTPATSKTCCAAASPRSISSAVAPLMLIRSSGSLIDAQLHRLSLILEGRDHFGQLQPFVLGRTDQAAEGLGELVWGHGVGLRAAAPRRQPWPVIGALVAGWRLARLLRLSCYRDVPLRS
jgi:hypothetical protein